MYTVKSILTKSRKDNKNNEEEGDDGSKLSHAIFYFFTFSPFFFLVWRYIMCIVRGTEPKMNFYL